MGVDNLIYLKVNLYIHLLLNQCHLYAFYYKKAVYGAKAKISIQMIYRLSSRSVFYSTILNILNILNMSSKVFHRL